MMFRVGLILPYLAFAASTVNAMMSHDKMMMMLGCNSDLGSATCENWSAQSYDLSQEVEIPCGKCIKMDAGNAEVLVFEKGLNVIGKLLIDTPVKIETPKVIVQGELHIHSDKTWNGEHDITITLTGTNDQSFMPADTNHMKCGMGECKVGKKPFAVGGGMLMIDGMPAGDYDTPTWLHIQDAKSEAGSGEVVQPIETYPGLVELEECPSDGNLIIEDFSNPSKANASYYQIESSIGSHFDYTEDALKVSGRNHKDQGPIFDLGSVLHCIKPNARYILSARVKTYRDEVGPDVIEPSDCKDGVSCLDVNYYYHPSEGKVWTHSKNIYHEEHTHGWQNGEEIFIAETVSFDEIQLNADNRFAYFSLIGVNPGITVEVYQFEFKLAPESAYRTSDDICPDLALPNGDAEMDPLSPFPYGSTSWWTNVFVAQDDEDLSNHFFRITARGNQWRGGLHWDTGLGCISDNAVYHVKVDYRIHEHEQVPDPKYGMRVRLKVKRADTKDQWYDMAYCRNDLNADNVGTWMTCEKMFTAPVGTVKDGDLQYEIQFETGPYADYDVDNISIKALSGPIKTVTVADSVEGKWGVGADVLITSHTSAWDGEQIRQITGIVPSDESGYVDLILNETIAAPTTMKDDDKYATEIAILSRNILLQGADDDSDSLHGGHLIILHTPGGHQSIVGLELTNMGQAGNLGRYPLHFHMCGDVEGSKLSKNLIRGTNQRCTVVHGTDKLLVENNVAYDTFGHCYMVEDGMERFNTFKDNLGAKTKKATQVIPTMADKNNGKETDGSASTFWITNPDNYYIGNVAAGGQHSGFWFELRDRPRGTMSKMYEGREWSLREMKLGQFKGNVAHSYDSAGIRTYPFGYVPNEQAIFEDSRVYRNSNSGMFIHNSRNIALSGNHFADNEQGVDLDRIDLFEMYDSEIVGRSQDYKTKVMSQKARNVCTWQKNVHGVEMHTFTHDRNLVSTLQGAFNNVKFSGFNDTGCEVSAVFVTDDEDRYPTWDYWTAIENSQTEGVDLANIANFCKSSVKNIPDAYITDHGSAFGASLDISGGISTIMTYTDTQTKMQTFVEKTSCRNFPEQCFSYCEDTCLRTMTVRVDPAVSPDYKLKICKDGTCETYNNWMYDSRSSSNWAEPFRTFSPALPRGSYTAEFLDENGDVSWPRGVNVTYEYDTCNGDGLAEGDVVFDPPQVTASECNQLISNGGADLSDTDPTPWVYERNSGVEIVRGAGMGGTNALGDVRTESHDDGISQHVDVRCFDLNAGRKYEVRAYVKLLNGNGQPVYCDPSVKHSSGCPRLMLHYGIYRQPNDKRRRDLEFEAGITRARHTNENHGFQLVHGIVTVDERLTEASNVRLYVERRANNMEMLVDDVSMTLLSDSTCEAGEELVLNGDFETGTSEHWTDRDAEGFHVVSPGVGGGFAFKMQTGSAYQAIKKECVEAGKRYEVQAKFRLLDWNGNTIECNALTGNPKCPELQMLLLDENNNRIEHLGVAKALDAAANTADADPYSSLWGIYEAKSNVAAADQIQIFFYNPHPYLIVDNISIKEMGASAKDGESSGGDLIVNGDTELGIAGFWGDHGVGKENLSIISDLEGGNALRVSGRRNYWSGAYYAGEKYIEKSVLEPGSTWKISLRVRLLEPGSLTGVDCNPFDRQTSETRCPRMKVNFYSEGDSHSPVRQETLYGYTSNWEKDGWNAFEGQVEVPSKAETVIDKMLIYVLEAKPNADIVIDNLSMVPV